MGLHLHSSALEAWLTEPDDEYDPIANVDFPRDTKNARKLNRDRILFEMRKVIMHRGPFRTERGFTFDLSPRMRAVELNSTRYERINLVIGTDSAVRRADLIRSWRYKLARARECQPAPLPRTQDLTTC